MYKFALHQQINQCLQDSGIGRNMGDSAFFARFLANASEIHGLYLELYKSHPEAAPVFERLLQTIAGGYAARSEACRESDLEKETEGDWFLKNGIAGMSLYVDRFAGSLTGLQNKLDYLENLGINLLHLMPVFQSPPGESDGGYAVSDFRKLDPRFGNLEQLQQLRQEMRNRKMLLMLDIVVNHTSDQHEWALQAKKGDSSYQEYFYMYEDRSVPDRFDSTMPDIFPESSPGNFTYVQSCNKWVMTVFHHYQWDLNYRNPVVLVEMLDNIFFYANLGIDILRIDAPAFMWKQVGTTCQNLPGAHTILRLIRQCVQVVAPGMALLGEAIVAPGEIMKYFGTGAYEARECDFAYNATQMAVQWDALATTDIRIMLGAQHDLWQKPYGTSWITYTRCHDDIGLGYDDRLIEQMGFNPFEHRKFLKDYYAGVYPGSRARGALFSVNPKTQDARISGSLASLCGLEKALETNEEKEIELAIRSILLMQAQSFFIGGVPMLFYGDEAGYTNDYSYLEDPAKSYDNRWMHRPVIDWNKNKHTTVAGTVEERIFTGTQKLIRLRKKLPVVGDHKNITWLSTHNIHVAGFIRMNEKERLFCLFNYSDQRSFLTWYVFRENGPAPDVLRELWSDRQYRVGADWEYLLLEPRSFLLLLA
jgi:amylosucrase